MRICYTSEYPGAPQNWLCACMYDNSGSVTTFVRSPHQFTKVKLCVAAMFFLSY